MRPVLPCLPGVRPNSVLRMISVSSRLILVGSASPGALIVAMRYAYKIAIDRESTLSDTAVILFVIQLLVVGLCFTGPVFNTQVGIMFWLATAMLYGCHRTLHIQEWHEQNEADAAEDAQA